MKTPRPDRGHRRTARLVLATGVTLVVLAAGAFVTWRLRTDAMVRSALVQGNAAFACADWNTARQMLGRYLSAHPEDTDVLAKYAHAQLAVRPLPLQNLRPATAAYRQLLRVTPNDENAFRQLVRLYEKSGNLAALETIATNRLAVCPDDAAATLARVKARLHRNVEDAPRTDLMRLVQRLMERSSGGPELIEACVLCANLARPATPSTYTADGEPGGLVWLDRAVEHCPTSAAALAQRAALRRVSAEQAPAETRVTVLSAARDDLERAAQLPADDPRVYLLVSDEWLAHGVYDRAADQLEAAKLAPVDAVEAVFVDPDDWVVAQFKQTAKLARATDAGEAGARWARDARTELRGRAAEIQILPDAIELLVAGRALNEARECLAEYLEAAKLERSTTERDERAAFLRALLARAQDEPYRVIECLQSVADGRATELPIHALLAEAYVRTGQLGRAAIAAPSLRDAGSRPATYRGLAQACLESGAWAHARLVLEPLAAGAATNIEIRLMLLTARLGSATESETPAGADAPAALADELGALQAAAPTRAAIRVLRAALAEWNGDLDEAETQLKHAIEQCADPLAAQLALARLYDHAGRYAAAHEVLQTACTQHGTHAAPWLALADWLAGQRQTEESRAALLAANAAVTARDDQRRVTIRWAVQEITDGNPSAGIATLRALAAGDPRDIGVRVLLLEIPQVLQEQTGAQRLVEEVRRLEGESGLLWRLHQARLWLAVEGNQQHSREIEDLLRNCVGTDPRWAQPVLVLGELYEQLGRRPEAVALYTQGFESSAAPEIAERLLTLLQADGRYAEARHLLDRLPLGLDDRAMRMRRLALALRAGPTDELLGELKPRVMDPRERLLDSVRLAGLLYLKNGDADRALAYLDEAAARGADPVVVARTQVVILKGEGRSAEAEDVLARLVQVTPSPEAYLVCGWYHVGTGQTDLAERDYVELSRAARDGFGAVVLGEFHAQAQRLAEAIRAWEEGLGRYPESVPLRRGLAKALLQRGAPGDHDRAGRILTTLRQALPNDTDLMWAQAVERAAAATPEALAQARELLRAAVDAAPAGPETYRGLAGLAFELGECATARALALRGLQAHPGESGFVLLRAQAELALRNLDAARELAQAVLDRGEPVAAAHEVLVTVWLQRDDRAALQRELAVLQQILDEDPQRGSFQVLRARVQAALGQANDAAANLAAFVATDPGDSDIYALLELEDLYRSRGDFAAAEELLTRVETLAPQSADGRYARLALLAAQARSDELAALLRAESHTRQPNTGLLVRGAQLLARSPAHSDAAVELCRRATEIAPHDARAHRVLGELAYERRDSAVAEQAFRAALRLDPTLCDVLNNLAWVLAERSTQGTEALECARQAVALRPANADFRDTLANVLLRLGKLDEAQVEFRRSAELSPAGSARRARSLLQLAQVCDQLADRARIEGYVQEALATDDTQAVFTAAERQALDTLLQTYRPAR